MGPHSQVQKTAATTTATARQRDVALAIAERGHSFDIGCAAFLLRALQILGRFVQRGVGEAGLAFVHLLLRLGQGRVDNVAEIGLRQAASDSLFVNFYRFAHRSHLTLKIERPVPGDPRGHFLNKALGHIARARCFSRESEKRGGVVLDRIRLFLQRSHRFAQRAEARRDKGDLRLRTLLQAFAHEGDENERPAGIFGIAVAIEQLLEIQRRLADARNEIAPNARLRGVQSGADAFRVMFGKSEIEFLIEFGDEFRVGFGFCAETFIELLVKEQSSGGHEGLVPQAAAIEPFLLLSILVSPEQDQRARQFANADRVFEIVIGWNVASVKFQLRGRFLREGLGGAAENLFANVIEDFARAFEPFPSKNCPQRAAYGH